MLRWAKSWLEVMDNAETPRTTAELVDLALSFGHVQTRAVMKVTKTELEQLKSDLSFMTVPDKTCAVYRLMGVELEVH